MKCISRYLLRIFFYLLTVYQLIYWKELPNRETCLLFATVDCFFYRSETAIVFLLFYWQTDTFY